MRLDVSHTFSDIGKRLAGIQNDIAEKVMARTLNKVTDGARGQMASAIAGEYVIKKGEVADDLHVTKASFKAGRLYMQATLAVLRRGKRKGFNLIRFVQGRRVVGGKGKPQLKFKIRRSGPLVMLKGAFIGNKGRTVFRREDSARPTRNARGRLIQGIEAKTTIEIAQMFNTKRVNAKVVKYINERLSIVAQQEIANVLRKK